jgi:hypothetical protein
MSCEYLAKILSSSSPPLHNLDQGKIPASYSGIATPWWTHTTYLYISTGLGLVTYFGKKFTDLKDTSQGQICSCTKIVMSYDTWRGIIPVWLFQQNSPTYWVTFIQSLLSANTWTANKRLNVFKKWHQHLRKANKVALLEPVPILGVGLVNMDRTGSINVKMLFSKRKASFILYGWYAWNVSYAWMGIKASLNN